MSSGMSTFFQQYGVEDERRSRTIWRIVYLGIALAIAGIVAYFVLHDFSENRVVSRFIEHVNGGRFEEAYREWGCSASHPCPNYDYKRFLDDWGPAKKRNSPWKIVSTDSCRSFVTANVKADGAELESLSVQRADDSLGFAPSVECQERKWRWRLFFSRLFGGGSNEAKP